MSILQPTLGAEKCQHVVETELAVMDEVVIRKQVSRVHENASRSEMVRGACSSSVRPSRLLLWPYNRTVPTRSPFPEISKYQKSEHILARGLTRPHSPVPQTMYFSQTKR